jgi:hypothetical protein
MKRVKAPNGLILDVPDSIASGLVGSRNHPGFEYVDDSAAQPPPLGYPGAPKAYASKTEWVEYAVSRGMDREEAERLSKTNLIDSLR